MMSIHLLMIITRSLVNKTDIIFDERHNAQIRNVEINVVSHFGSVDQNVIFQELIIYTQWRIYPTSSSSLRVHKVQLHCICFTPEITYGQRVARISRLARLAAVSGRTHAGLTQPLPRNKVVHSRCVRCFFTAVDDSVLATWGELLKIVEVTGALIL